MKWKTTLVLLIVTIAIGAFVSLYEIRQPAPEDRQAVARRVVQIPAGDVKRLVVQFPEARVTLERRGDAWQLTSPKAVRAEESLLRRILDELDPLEAEHLD